MGRWLLARRQHNSRLFTSAAVFALTLAPCSWRHSLSVAPVFTKSSAAFATPSFGGRLQRRSYVAAAAARSGTVANAPKNDVASNAPRLASVGIIGGGVAGLACARRLKELGISATVFDTGKHRPGGRASSRLWRGHVVDHAAQFVATTDPEFRTAVESSKAARPWGKDGRFGVLRQSGYSPVLDGIHRWVGTDGFASIISAFANDIDVRQDVWVPPSKGIQCQDDGTWTVVVPGERGGRSFETFDAVVIAHNGKCAERLTSKTPAVEVHTLLRTAFAPNLRRDPAPGSGKFTLNSVYSLLFEVPEGVMPDIFDGAFIEHESSLRWLSSNSAKLGKSSNRGAEAWTALSSAEFGKQHKAPQEFLEGTETEAKVTGLLLAGIERALGLQPNALDSAVTASKLQLWGAALPINRWESSDGVDFVWSGAHNIGIAGDWLAASPHCASTVEAAWLSGTRLAEHVARDGADDAGLKLGDDGGRFVPVNGEFGDGGRVPPSWVTIPSGKQSRSRGRGRSANRRGRGGVQTGAEIAGAKAAEPKAPGIKGKLSRRAQGSD